MFSGKIYYDDNEKEDYDRVKEEKEKYDVELIIQMVYSDIGQEEYKEKKWKIMTEQYWKKNGKVLNKRWISWKSLIFRWEGFIQR